MMKVGIGAVILLALAAFLFLGGGSVGSAEARKLVEGGARLVDVRTVDEFASGHLPGALNIPVQNLEQRLTELGPKEGPIVVYCRSGARSGRAARMLKSAGYIAVHDLGPMSRW